MAVNLSRARLLTVLWCGWGIHGEGGEKVRKSRWERKERTNGGFRAAQQKMLLSTFFCFLQKKNSKAFTEDFFLPPAKQDQM